MLLGFLLIISLAVAFSENVEESWKVSGRGTDSLLKNDVSASANRNFMKVTKENKRIFNDVTVLSQPTSTPTMNVNTPYIVAAQLSSDGRYCTITFDSATNKGGNAGSTFSCSSILDFTGNNVATCLWQDAYNIAIYPDFSTAANIQNAINVGSVIRLLSGNNIYSNVCNVAKLNRGCIAAALQTVFVLGPLNPVTPYVSIKSSHSISSCSPWLIDLTGCTGDGQRGWSSITVKVSSSDPSMNTTGLAGYIKNHFTTTVPLNVPQTYLTMGATYNLTITLCNIFLDCASGKITVDITSGSFSAPVVSLIGSIAAPIYTTTNVAVNAIAYVVGCAGTTTSVGLTYNWQVLVGNTPMQVNQVMKTSQLTIPSYSLQIGQTYTIQVTVTDSNTKLNTVGSSTFTVMTSALVAAVSPSTIQLVRAGKSLVISGASSYDPDDPNSDYGYLNYRWSCVGLTYQGRVNPKCLLTIVGPMNASTLTVTGDANAINSTSLLTLYVTKDTRNATASVKVQIIESSAPQVTIQTSTSSVSHVNAANSLLLSGLVDSSYDVSCSWSVSSGTLDLTKAALSSVTKSVAANSPTTFNLYLAGNSLPVRSTYGFSLTCLSSTAFITVTTNGPPVGGIYSISPVDGIEMQTIFTASTSQWSDPDLPITYLFGFISPSTGLVSTVQSRSSLTYTTTTLPGGLDSLGYAVATIVQAYDGLNCSAQLNISAIVTLLPASQVSQTISAQLNATKGSTNLDDIKSVISVASSVISRVNCTGFSATYCSGLNRGPCAATSFTCGACLTGYVGQQGDANTACVSSTSSSPPQQQCNPTDCSGHGSCKLYDRTSGLEISTCSVLSSTCYAMCVCSSDYYSTDCSLTSSELQSQQSLRSNLLTSLSYVVQNEDTTVETVTNVVSSLSGIVQTQNDVNTDSVGTFSSIAHTTLTQAKSDATISADAFNGLMGPTNAAINAQAANAGPASALALGNSIISTYSWIVNRGAAPGVPPSSLLYSNFRYAQQSMDISDSVSLKVPQTAAENHTDSPVTQLSVVNTGGSNGNATTVSLSLTQYSANLLNVSQSKFSSILWAKVSTSSMDHMILLQLANIAGSVKPLASQIKAVNFTTHCQNGDYGTYTKTCEGSSQVLSHTCHGIKGDLISYCPVLAPLCNSVNMTDGTVGVALDGYTCAVSNMTTKYITCKCYPNSNGRRLSTQSVLVDSGAITALAILDYTANEVGQTFQAAPDLTSPQAISRALITIVMFAVLWAGGLLLITGCFIRQRQLRQESLERKLNDAGKSYQNSETTSIEEIRERLTKYVDSVFPVIFYPGHLLLRLKDEIRRNHRYLMMFMLLDGELEGKKRYINGIQLLTIQSALMFLLALLYDIQQPTDDGTCPGYTTESACLSRTSVFDSSRTYCVWNDGSSANCQFNDSSVSFQATIFIQVIVSVMSALIMRPLYYLFDILLAPNVDNMKAKLAEEAALKSIENVGANRQSMIGRVTRRVGRVANSVASMIKFAQPRHVDPKDLENMPVTLISDEVEMVHTEAKAYFRKLTQRAQAYSDGNVVPGQNNPSNHGERKSMRFTVMKKIQSAYAEYVGKVESEHKEAAEKLWEELQALLVQQRGLLQGEEVEIFDAEWGLDPATGQFLIQRDSDKHSKDVAKIIQKELALVERDANEAVERLHLAVDSHIGFEVLSLFILDILGRDTPSARIFANKMEEDFPKTSVKTRREKIIAAVIITAANALFIYYSILRGYVQGVNWQKSYLIACLVQMMLEIYLFETIECIWINVFVPSLVSSEVQRVNTLLLGIINDLCNKVNMGQKLFVDELEPGYPLDVTKFLFTSTRVAKAHPALMESMIVRSYHTHLPGEFSRKWTRARETKVTKGGWFHMRHHRENISLPMAMIGSVILTLQIAAMTPFDLQKMFIRFVQPFLYGGLILLGQKIVSSTLSITITAIILFLIVAFIVYQYFRYESSNNEDGRLSKIQPISPVPVADEAKPFPHLATPNNSNNNSSDALAKKKEVEYLRIQRENLRQKANAWAISESKSSESEDAHSKEYNIRTVESTRRLNRHNSAKKGIKQPPTATNAPPAPAAAASGDEKDDAKQHYHQWESSEEKSEMGGKDSYLFSSSESPSKLNTVTRPDDEEEEEEEDMAQLHQPKQRGNSSSRSNNKKKGSQGSASTRPRNGTSVDLESYNSLSLDDSFHPLH